MKDAEPVKNLRPVILSAFGPPSLACLRSWGRAGMSPGMISIQSKGDPRPGSRYLTASVCLQREELCTEEGLRRIVEFLKGFDATGLTCIDENIALWLNEQRQHLPKGVALWLPPGDMLCRVLDKDLQLETARQVGLNVLPTYLFVTSDFNNEIPDSHFPLCLRPSVPGSIIPTFKVENVDSIQELSCFLDPLTIRKPIIGQPFKNFPNLVVHGSRTLDGRTVGMEGFLVERKFQGVTLTLRPEPLIEDLKSRCIAFTETMELTGNYHFEFLYDSVSGENYFLEINHRFGGTTAKVMVCGYQEPLYALQAQGVYVPVHSMLRNVKVSSIKALLKSAYYALTDRLTPLDYPEESKKKRIWSSLQCLILCRDEVFAWDDLTGTAVFYLGDLPDRLNRSVVACRNLLYSGRGNIS